MKFLRNIIISLVAILPVLTSCKQDDTLQYNNMTMGNITDGTFVSDLGNIFNVVEKNCSGDLTSMKRALLLCDVLNKVEGTENEYDIRLNQMSEVLVKNPITKSDADDDDETRVADPILIDQMWISGGYINMFLIYEFRNGSTQKHLVNLVLDESASINGKYVFTLRHNSYGESMANDAAGMILSGAYVSFPITDIIKENTAEISVGCDWYKSAGQGWISETQTYSYNLTYTKGGFEQAPVKMSNRINTLFN